MTGEQEVELTIKPFVMLSFEDEDGYRFGWTYSNPSNSERPAQDQTTAGKWEFVDADSDYVLMPTEPNPTPLEKFFGRVSARASEMSAVSVLIYP